MATWGECVTAMAGFYQQNIHTYQGHEKGSSSPVKTNAWVPCPLLGGNVRDDCSGFVSACLQLAGVFPKGMLTSSLGFSSATGSVADKLKAGGFQPIPYNEAMLQPGDIYSGNNGKFHHVEICAAKGKTYSWGNVHDIAHGGMPSGFYRGAYTIIWRLGADAGQFNIAAGGAMFGPGTILKYEVPRNEQEDHKLMNHIQAVQLDLFKEILESEGVLFSGGKYSKINLVDDFLIKDKYNYIDIDNNWKNFITKEGHWYNKTKTESELLFLTELEHKDVLYRNEMSEGDVSISEGIALNAVELGIFPAGAFGGSTDLGAIGGAGDAIATTGNATVNKEAFMSVLQQYGSAIGLKNTTGLAVLLGQVAVESGNFKYMAEIGAGKGKKYGQPAGPYNKVYYGRGPIQVTWYDNYKKIYENFFKPNGLGQYDVVANPDLANDPRIGSLLSMGWFMLPGNGKKAVEAANAGNVKTCRRMINGGYNGLEHCQKFTAQIAQTLGVQVNLEG